MRPERLTATAFGKGIADRLAARRAVMTLSGCWEWTGAKNTAGYGIIKVGGRAGWVERCHRVSHAIYNGPIDPGVRVLHRCDNPPCFNPEHLFAGTAQDNTDDMIAKGRRKTPQPVIGERSNLAKLTAVDVAIVIDRLLRGDTRTSIANDYGVSISAISRIAVGANWKHLTAGRGIVKSTRGIRRTNV